MSHNIGSHVFSHLIGNNVYSLLSDENVLKDSPYVSLYDEQLLSTNNLQLAYFNQYLKNRMDYLGEVMLNVPNMLTTKYIYGDVFKELDRVRILLRYISGISDFKYKFCLKYNGEVLSEKKDIAVAFSSDMLGTQAFYNILENVIRNTAKHACYNNQEDVNVITIEFKDEANYPGHYCVEIDNGVVEDSIDDLVKRQNLLINEPIVDEDFHLRNYGLGVVEMMASAAFLRQINIVNIDSKKYHSADNDSSGKPILMEAFNKNGSLAYRFYMPKPKEFLFVGNWTVDESRKSELVNIGLKFIDEDDFMSAMENGVSFSHPFLFYRVDASTSIKKFLSDDNICRTLLPIKKLELGNEDIINITSIINLHDISDIVGSIKKIAWTMYHENVVARELKNPQNKEVTIRTAFDSYKGGKAFICNQVVFLNHSYRDVHEKTWKVVCSTSEYEVWIENLSSRTSAKLPFFSQFSTGEEAPISNYVENIKNEKHIKYEIFEAYHNKVIVLDERIQHFSKTGFEGSSGKEGGPIPCSELYESTNVLIPDIPLDKKNISQEVKKKLEQFINDNIDNAFILVHYGFMERLYKRDVESITKILDEWAKKAKRVVVTSGRGAKSITIPNSVCFADLASVLYAFEGGSRNKFTINDLLHQSRRKHE